MSLTLQYIVIFILFIIAVVVLWFRFFPSQKSKNNCGTNCKCDASISPKKDNFGKNL